MLDFNSVLPEIHIVAIRSRGPGGQNVNKVSSGAQLFWSYVDSAALSDHEKWLIGSKLKNMINKDGQIYLRADEFRDLARNKARAVEKLQDLLIRALHKPKARKKTKPTRAARAKTHEAKVHRGKIKQARKKVSW